MHSPCMQHLIKSYAHDGIISSCPTSPYLVHASPWSSATAASTTSCSPSTLHCPRPVDSLAAHTIMIDHHDHRHHHHDHQHHPIVESEKPALPAEREARAPGVDIAPLRHHHRRRPPAEHLFTRGVKSSAEILAHHVLWCGMQRAAVDSGGGHHGHSDPAPQSSTYQHAISFFGGYCAQACVCDTKSLGVQSLAAIDHHLLRRSREPPRPHLQSPQPARTGQAEQVPVTHRAREISASLSAPRDNNEQERPVPPATLTLLKQTSDTDAASVLNLQPTLRIRGWRSQNNRPGTTRQ
jgi:hypothetical protein